MKTELSEALDKVVEDIKSMPKEVLEQKLKESAKTVFAQTIDELTNMEKNIE